MANFRSPPRTPSYEAIYSVTAPGFLLQVREIEYIRSMEIRLELESLVCGDPAYHPLGYT